MIYRTNSLKIIFDTVISLLLVSGCVYASIYFREILLYGDVYFFLCATMFIIRLFALLSSYCLRIKIDKNILTIQYLFRKKIIHFSTIKDFSVFQGYKYINLYFIENKKIVKINLNNYDQIERIKIADKIAEIMHDYFVNYSEEQLVQYYEDINQYDFTVMEKHNPFILFLILFVGFITFVTVVAIILNLCIIKPKEGLYSVVEEWFIFFYLMSIITVYLLDKFSQKKTLSCKNGIISLFKNQKIIYTVNVNEIIEYSISFQAFIVRTNQNPQKETVINIMGFSRKEKKALHNKLETLIPLDKCKI